jgi:hypothetical protein
VPHVNNSLAEDLDKFQIASYFARWEAYNELSKKLFEQESKELVSALFFFYLKVQT